MAESGALGFKSGHYQTQNQPLGVKPGQHRNSGRHPRSLTSFLQIFTDHCRDSRGCARSAAGWVEILLGQSWIEQLVNSMRANPVDLWLFRHARARGGSWHEAPARRNDVMECRVEVPADWLRPS